MKPKTIIAPQWKDYELIDCGEGEKLERFGNKTIRRPEINATEPKQLSDKQWNNADLTFTEIQNQRGKWLGTNTDTWKISYPLGSQCIDFLLKIGDSKQLGVFPEQAYNWHFINKLINKNQDKKVLNLFAYTGGASMASSLAGAHTTHIDSVKTVVNWAAENAQKSGISNISWVVEDAFYFLNKEVIRGNKYDIIVMDPPPFGISKNGKRWILSKHLPQLINQAIMALLNSQSLIILNTYGKKLNAENIQEMVQKTPSAKVKEQFNLALKSSKNQLLNTGLVTIIKKVSIETFFV